MRVYILQFPLYTILDNGNHSDRELISDGLEIIDVERERLQMGKGKLVEVMNMFIILMVVIVSWVNTCAKT